MNAQLVGGLLLLFAGNGGVTVAETRLPSGVAALLVATVPLWMIVFAWPVQHQLVTARYACVNPVVAVLAGIVFLGEQFSWREGLGAALVLASVVVILNRPRGEGALPRTVRQRTAAQSAISGGTAQ